MNGQGLLVHLGLLVVAAGSSVYVWTRDTPSMKTFPDVTLWPGRADDVRRIAFEENGAKVDLESREDPQGRWFAGVTQARPPAAQPDGGAPPHAVHGHEPTPERLGPVPVVSIAVGHRIAQALAPFKAVRELGPIDAARNAEFGFKDPPSTLVVDVGGQEHRLTVGAATPGGGDRYVRNDVNGNVYVVRGEFLRDLESGEGALIERELHSFQDADLTGATIVAGGKRREALRGGPPTKRIWSDPASPDQPDETIANWLGKVDRLRPTEYVNEPPSPHETVVRVEYKAKGADGAFLELARVPAAGAGANGAPKADYYVRTEHTRMWAKTNPQWGEQVDQDLASVLK